MAAGADFGALIRAVKGRDEQLGRPQGLAGFLRHAVSTTVWYREGSLQLADYPSVSRVTVSRHAKELASSAYSYADLAFWRTSGTSGVPLAVPRDPASSYLFAYDSYRQVGEVTGGWLDLCRPGHLAVVQLNDNPLRTQQILVNPALGNALMRRVVLHQDDARAQMLVDSLYGSAPVILAGRPRALVRLGQLVESSTKLPGLVTVVASGDNLHPPVRRAIESSLHVPVFNVYASQECGLLAVSCPRDSLHVIETRAVVEVLTSGGDVRSSGEGELLVTNMENWALPLIRYRTGDFGALARSDCGCGKAGTVISDLTGRDSVYFTLGGRRFNPSTLVPILDRHGILQWEVEQRTDESLRVVLVVDGTSSTDGVRTLVAAELRKIGFPAVQVMSTDTTDLYSKRPRFRLQEPPPAQHEAETERSG